MSSEATTLVPRILRDVKASHQVGGTYEVRPRQALLRLASPSFSSEGRVNHRQSSSLVPVVHVEVVNIRVTLSTLLELIGEPVTHLHVSPSGHPRTREGRRVPIVKPEQGFQALKYIIFAIYRREGALG